jgi:hypothetical protein
MGFLAYRKIILLKKKEKKYLESFKKYTSYRMSLLIKDRQNYDLNEIKL